MSLILFAVLPVSIGCIWLVYHFGYRVLDVFSPTKREYGIVVEKEYIPARSEIIMRVVHRHAEEGFGPTSYTIPDEIQIPEKHLLHIGLNGRTIVATVKEKLYDRVSQGGSILVKYSQGRFSKRLYLKRIQCPPSPVNADLQL